MKKEFLQKIYNQYKKCPEYPSIQMIEVFFDNLLTALFPVRGELKLSSVEELGDAFLLLRKQLRELISICLASERLADQHVEKFFSELPAIYEVLLTDLEATFQGDPAAKNKEIVMKSYPGFYATVAYRVAHSLASLEVNVLPRSITEIAHQKTGIDIHPSATIGNRFCIDHGTGVVIGETTLIGENVKIYQGVTLGALSVRKEDASSKRHPTIEDDVVIYAGATILGGKTIVGKGSVIGGNVWLPKSVKAGSKVYYKAQMQSGDGQNVDTYIFKNNQE